MSIPLAIYLSNQILMRFFKSLYLFRLLIAVLGDEASAFHELPHSEDESHTGAESLDVGPEIGFVVFYGVDVTQRETDEHRLVGVCQG